MKQRFAILILFLFVPRVWAEDKTPVRVAVYVDGGTSAGKETVLNAVRTFHGFKVEPIKAEDIQSGKLKDYQVLIVPGGTGKGEAKALAEKGCAEIKKFVKEGGSYVGICAGSYLASSDYDWSLGILNAKVLDRKHWARGHGPVQIAFTDKGKAILGTTNAQTTIVYWQGPLLAPGDKKDIPPFETLARFETEIVKNGAPEGVMKGSVAIAAGTFGKGRVLCFSPHPEKMEPTQDLLRMALRWVNARAK